MCFKSCFSLRAENFIYELVRNFGSRPLVILYRLLRTHTCKCIIGRCQVFHFHKNQCFSQPWIIMCGIGYIQSCKFVTRWEIQKIKSLNSKADSALSLKHLFFLLCTYLHRQFMIVDGNSDSFVVVLCYLDMQTPRY